MTKKEMCAEMARRKVRFHPNEKWDEIKLWGLFEWGNISKWVKSGDLKTSYTRENKIVWVQPSEKLWKDEIKPLTEQYSLEMLTQMAGW